MSTSDLTRFPGGTQDKGINTFEPDIGAEITWDETTHDVTGGVRRGVGPRYGMAPLGGHSNTETPPGNETNGLMKSETASGAGLKNRERIYGIVPLTITAYGNDDRPKANHQYYAYIVGLDYSATVSLDVCVGATLVSSVNKQASDFRAGLAESSYLTESPLVRRHKTELMNLPQNSTPTAADMQALLVGIAANWWAPYAHISISGKRVPYQWQLGAITSIGGASTAPNVCTWQTPVTSGTSPTILGGCPSELVTREFTANNARTLTVYCLLTTGYNGDISYTVPITNANTSPQIAYNAAATYTNLTGATKTGGTNYSDQTAALLLDPGSYTNTRHEAILLAGETPYAVVYQDWLYAVKGFMPRWVDLTNPGCNPRIGISLAGSAIGGNTPSSFYFAQDLVESVSAGILSKNTYYDFGFSYYNKLLDYETNVVYGTTLTPVADLTAMEILTNSGPSANTAWSVMQSTADLHLMPWEYSDTAAKSGEPVGRGFSINDYEIKFYYREVGTGDWLPAGNFDAAQLWFYPFTKFSQQALICVGPVAGLIGGQPNGFIDYSPLPKQRYICTVVYQNRAFWWSEKTMQFSIQNNIYVYPTRNIVAGQTGKWRGGIVHIRTGQVEQTSRLVIFGDTAYIGVFTGNKTLQNVRVSAQTIGQFEVDGSDFRLDYLCDATAFSFRAAAVAEGVLYWWGQQGVYMDNGVDSPVKISGVYEPEILQLVDMGRDSEVHCVYNKRTSEVIWFYPPKVTDLTYPTYTLIYNVANQKFYNGKIPCQVDSSQIIRLENDDTPDDVDGERILVHCRDTTASVVSRTFYFDDICKSGDQSPGTELLCKQVTIPVAGTRRLIMAAGHVNLTTISVNDYVAIQNVAGYDPSLTTATNMIAKVTAVSQASDYIEIALPEGAVLPAATMTEQNAFPVYHGGLLTDARPGLHGIKYQVQTNYWLPDGVASSWLWQFFYFLYKYTKWAAPIGARIAFAYRTLRCGGFTSDTLSLEDNSDGHAQIHHPLRPVQASATGQAIKYKLSGVHIGHEWTLEYLEAHCLKERGFTLKAFEG